MRDVHRPFNSNLLILAAHSRSATAAVAELAEVAHRTVAVSLAGHTDRNSLVVEPLVPLADLRTPVMAANVAAEPAAEALTAADAKIASRKVETAVRSLTSAVHTVDMTAGCMKQLADTEQDCSRTM